MKTFVKQLTSFTLPVTASILVPGWLICGANIPQPHFAQMIGGGGLTFAGLTLLVSTIRLFILIGKGTLAPWSPTQRLVVAGPYRYTRNPMISGVLFILLGEALVLSSLPILVWSVMFWLTNTVYFIYSEEPGLVKRFGQDYLEYKKNVPRWIPMLKPWSRE